jgi:ATP-dependent protease ClpP protease subunit
MVTPSVPAVFPDIHGVFADDINQGSVNRIITGLTAGQVASAAVVAFLGAKRRVATKNSVFMLHRSHNSPQFATASKLARVVETLNIDDKRTEDIFRAHVKMPDELWTQLENHDLFLTGEDAVKFGIATELGDFAPPMGTQIYKL